MADHFEDTPLFLLAFSRGGRWAVAARRPVHEVAYRNAWGVIQVPEPLWPGADA
jgi:hypothetical protein